MNEECGINWDEQEKISWDDAEKIDNRTLLIVNLPDQQYTPYFIEVDHVERHGDVIQVYDKFVYDVDLRDPSTCLKPFHIDGEHYDFTKEEWEGNVFAGGPEIEDAVYGAASDEREGKFDSYWEELTKEYLEEHGNEKIRKLLEKDLEEKDLEENEWEEIKELLEENEKLREEAEFYRLSSCAAELEKERLETEMLCEAAERERREYLDWAHGKYSGYGPDSFMCYMSDYD